MIESQLNIKVTTDNAALQALIDKLNSGNITVGEFSKTMRQLKNESVAGSQSLRDLNDVNYQVLQSSKSVEAQERSFTNVIRESRQERRLYMFAVNEGLHAIIAATGGENEFAKAVTGGASAVFGMQFALKALGGVFAEFALPIALAIGLWTVLKSLWGDSEKTLASLREEQLKDIEILIKLGEATTEQKEKLLQAQLAQAQSVLTEMQSISTIQAALITFTGGKITGGTASATDIAAQKIKVDALRLSIAELHKQESEENAKLLDDFKNRMDEQIAEKNKLSVQQQKDANQRRAQLIEEQDYLYAIGKLTDREYMNILETRREQDEKVKSRKEELAVMQQMEKLQVKLGFEHPEEIGLSGELAGKNYATGKYGLNMARSAGLINPDQFGKVKSTEEIDAKARAKAEASATNQYLVEPLRAGFQSVTYSAMAGLNRMWEQSSGFARTVLGQVFESIADDILNKLAIRGTESLLSMIPGFGFLAPHAAGGWLNEPVVGIGMSTGRIHTFAERQPEYIATMSQMIHASRNSNINIPAPQIIPLISASGVSVMVKYGEQTRADRKW